MFLFLIGGIVYVLLELSWRGYSHVSMAIAGGLCFILLYGVLTLVPTLALPLRALIGATIITAVEFITGAIVNIRMGLKVWDYSALPANCYGQICLAYSMLWLLLSVPITVIVDVIHRLLS